MSSTYTDLQYTSFPDDIQSFVTMLDMAVNDAPAINGYQRAMREGDYNTAQAYLTQITNGNQKIIDATKLNTLLDTCVALQRFYATDIEPYINNKQTVWENNVNRFSYLGEYSASSSYLKNNFVTSVVNGVKQVFICITNAPAGTSVTNTNYWRQLTIRGLQGPSGAGLTFRFQWDSSQVYYVDDIVTYGDSIWNCAIENSNQTPYEGSSYWILIHSPTQDIYPFSQIQPSMTQIGALWFQII
jgi:hypothetical protein